jgi:lysophospholipase L1-like esterase
MYDRSTLFLFLFFAFFGLSLLANAILIPLAGYWLQMRGGLKYFQIAALKGNRVQSGVSNRREFYHAFSSSQRVARPIVMFGDSLTASGLWSEWYSIEVLNRGIHGETTQDALMRVPDIIALNPSKVFILFGVNDFGVLPAEVTVANMREIVSRLHTGSPASEIYIQSILPPPAIDREHWVSAVNDGYKHIAREYQLHWIDLFSPFSVGPVINRQLTVDGVHLSPEGYEVWRHWIERFVSAQTAEMKKQLAQ